MRFWLSLFFALLTTLAFANVPRDPPFSGLATQAMASAKQGTNSLQVWIGANYEEKDGKVLFHFLASGVVCTLDSTGTNVFEYYHADHLRSTSILTDKNGNRIQHHEYSAFGRDRFTESSTAFPASRRYTSQVLDEDTGLYFYGSRYYDPQLGRFIQPDTIIPSLSNPQSYNRYSYVLNNPLKHTDPDGHQARQAPQARGVITEEILSSLRNQRETAAQVQMREAIQLRFQFAPRSRAPQRPLNPTGQAQLWELKPGQSVFDPAPRQPTRPAPLPKNSLSSRNAPQGQLEFRFEGAAEAALLARLPAGANNAGIRLTQAGDEFVHYGYAEHAAGWIAAGARPGTYAGTIEASTGAEAQNIYNLPRWRSPPNSYYIIRPPEGTPVQGPGRVMPAYGRDVPGKTEFIFPQGTPPGSVSGPFPIPPR